MPVSLIIDDAVPVVNALYYFRLQINQEGYNQLSNASRSTF